MNKFMLFLIFTFLTGTASIAQDIDIIRSVLAKEAPITDGYVVKEIFAGKGDDLFIVWVLPPGGNYILSKFSARTGELRFAKKYAKKIGSLSFFFIDGKVLAIHSLFEAESFKFNYAGIDEMGEISNEQLLFSMPATKDDEITLVPKAYRNWQGDGLLLTFYRYNAVSGKMLSRRFTLVEVDKFMKTSQYEYDIPIIKEFRLENLKPDEAGNLNGLAIKLEERDKDLVTKTSADFISLRRVTRDVLLINLQLSGLNLISAGHDSKKGRTVITGYAGEYLPTEGKIKTPMLNISSIITFFTEVNINAGKTESEQFFKPGEQFVSTVTQHMETAIENYNQQRVKLEVDEVVISQSGHTNMISSVLVQYSKSGNELYYPAEILVLHFDGTGFQKWLKDPHKYKLNCHLLAVFKGQKEPAFFAYSVGYTVPGKTQEEAYCTVAAVKDDGISMPVISTDEEKLLDIDPAAAGFFIANTPMENDRYLLLTSSFKKPHSIYLFEQK